VTWRDGTAEATGLPDACVDVVVCAQAFHWFRPDEALPEIHRVLRRGGSLALIWNTRDLDDPVQARLDEVLRRNQSDALQRLFDDDDHVVRDSPLFGDVEYRAWPNEQRVTLPELLDVIASRSYVAALDAGARAAVLDDVRAAVAGLSEAIVLRYVADVFVADREP
jgi:SAM-dependent methyltransferase